MCDAIALAVAPNSLITSIADAEATPPIGEGFGLVYAEAGAFGVPSIGSTAAGGAAVTHGAVRSAPPERNRTEGRHLGRLCPRRPPARSVNSVRNDA